MIRRCSRMRLRASSISAVPSDRWECTDRVPPRRQIGCERRFSSHLRTLTGSTLVVRGCSSGCSDLPRRCRRRPPALQSMPASRLRSLPPLRPQATTPRSRQVQRFGTTSRPRTEKVAELLGVPSKQLLVEPDRVPPDRPTYYMLGSTAGTERRASRRGWAEATSVKHGKSWPSSGRSCIRV
jgi:hypothetical protein